MASNSCLPIPKDAELVLGNEVPEHHLGGDVYKTPLDSIPFFKANRSKWRLSHSAWVSHLSECNLYSRLLFLPGFLMLVNEIIQLPNELLGKDALH